jgi:hypothetical protein
MGSNATTTFERIALTNPHADLARYEDLARRSVDAGVTHVTVSALAEKSRWELDDPADPYLHWAIIHASLYKVVPPELLTDWVPAKYARQFLDLIRRRCDILEKLKLKAAFLSYEPTWWPESAFAKAPQLRGPRVDHPRRSKHPRFSPDISNARVLDIYRQMMRRFIEQVPSIKLLIFSTNDSGSGIPWSEHLYNHPNGPSYTPWLPFGQRLKTFLDTCEQGAADAGSRDTECYIRALMEPAELDSARTYLTRDDGTTRIAFFSLSPFKEDSLQGLTSTYLYPLADLGQPMALLRRLNDAADRGRHGVIVNPMAEAFITEWEGDGPDLEVLRAFLDERPRDVLAMTQTLSRVMAEKYGPEWGPRVLQMYWHLDRAMSALEPINSGGMLFEIWLLANRWLTRPLVPLPELLTDEEKSHYRPHVFQALGEEQADNPLEAQAVQIISGVQTGKHLVPQILRMVESEVHRAIAALGGGELPPDLRRLRERLRGLVCLVRCCDNVVQFSTLAEHVCARASRSADGQIIPPAEDNWGNHGDREERSALYNLMRAEIDNTQELIDLLESSKDPVFVLAKKPEDEDIFLLSPELTDQLRKKIRIMLDHWLDVNLLLRRPNL